MPGYKHPCPFCSTFIESGVAACPVCGVIDPFTQGRCPDCRAPLQAGWIACPKCGRSLTAADTSTAARAVKLPSTTPTTPPQDPRSPAPPQADPAPSPPAADRCSGCGAALPAGARFCTECGTLVS